MEWLTAAKWTRPVLHNCRHRKWRLPGRRPTVIYPPGVRGSRIRGPCPRSTDVHRRSMNITAAGITLAGRHRLLRGRPRRHPRRRSRRVSFHNFGFCGDVSPIYEDVAAAWHNKWLQRPFFDFAVGICAICDHPCANQQNTLPNRFAFDARPRE